MATKNPHAVALGRLGGAKGGKVSMRNRTAEVSVDLIESLFGKSTLMRKPAG